MHCYVTDGKRVYLSAYCVHFSVASNPDCLGIGVLGPDFISVAFCVYSGHFLGGCWMGVAFKLRRACISQVRRDTPRLAKPNNRNMVLFEL